MHAVAGRDTRLCMAIVMVAYASVAFASDDVAFFVVGDSWASALGPSASTPEWSTPSHNRFEAALSNAGLSALTGGRVVNLSVPGSTAAEWRADNPCYNEPVKLPHVRCTSYRGLMTNLRDRLRATNARLPIVYLSLGAGDLLSDASFLLGPRKGIAAVLDRLEDDLERIIFDLVDANPDVLIVIPGYSNFNPAANGCDGFLGLWQMHMRSTDARSINRVFFQPLGGLVEVYRNVVANWPGTALFANVHTAFTSYARRHDTEGLIDWFKPSPSALWHDCFHPKPYAMEVFATAVLEDALRQLQGVHDSNVGLLGDGLSADSFLFNSNRRRASQEIFRLSRNGERDSIAQLTDDAHYDSWWPKLAPDRRQILFQRTPTGAFDVAYDELSFWLVDVDGTNLRMLRPPAARLGWGTQGHADWSPDGREIVIAGGPLQQASNLWVIDAVTGDILRKLTHFTTGAASDPSWSPDGKRIVFTATVGDCAAGEVRCYELHSIDSRGRGQPVRHTYDTRTDFDPYLSPDGMQIAWLSVDRGDSMTKPSRGLRVAAFSPDRPLRYECWVINGTDSYSKPEWDEQGAWLWSHRGVAEHPQAAELFRVRASCDAHATATPIEAPVAGTHQLPDLH